MNVTPGVLRALSSWNAMIQRCFDESRPAFADYGGRGITVCARWLDPWAFIADLGERPDGLSLGRINNDGIYEPSNCRWETDMQQARNTRRNVFIGGKTQSQVAAEAGVNDATVKRRRDAGRPVDVPRYFKRNKLTSEDVQAMKALFAGPLSNSAIARQFSVSHTLVGLIRQGRIWRDPVPLHTMAKMQMQSASPTLEWD